MKWWCLFLVACVDSRPVVRVDGSSSVYPLTEAIAEDYLKQRPSLELSIGVSGTAGGLRRFCRGELDVAQASRSMLPEEVALCAERGIAWRQVAVARDAVVVVAHKASTFLDMLSIGELQRIWRSDSEGRILRWSDVRPSWPDLPLRLYGASPDSGTFDFFTRTILQKARASRGDYFASEDDNMLASGVAADPGALGYFSGAYYRGNEAVLRLVPIDIGDGPVDTPFARTLFLFVNTRAEQRAEVAAFVAHYVQRAPEIAPSIGFHALDVP